MTRYWIEYDVRESFYVDADSMEEAVAEANDRLEEYPEIAFRIGLEDDE